jgi:hypothetical protein
VSNSAVAKTLKIWPARAQRNLFPSRRSPRPYPAAKIAPAIESLTWFIDAAAAAGLQASGGKAI